VRGEVGTLWLRFFSRSLEKLAENSRSEGDHRVPIPAVRNPGDVLSKMQVKNFKRREADIL
jgi:hypothetical protein